MPWLSSSAVVPEGDATNGSVFDWGIGANEGRFEVGRAEDGNGGDFLLPSVLGWLKNEESLACEEANFEPDDDDFVGFGGGLFFDFDDINIGSSSSSSSNVMSMGFG